MSKDTFTVGTHLDELILNGKDFMSPCYGYPKHRFVVAPKNDLTSCAFMTLVILEIDFQNGSSIEANMRDVQIITTPDLHPPPIQMIFDLAKTSTHRFNAIINNQIVPKTATHLFNFMGEIRPGFYEPLILNDLAIAYNKKLGKT